MKQPLQSSVMKAKNKTALLRRVASLKIGEEFTVDSDRERRACLSAVSHLEEMIWPAREPKFRIKTWLNQDGTYTIHATKP